MWEYTVIYLTSFELSKEANSLIDVLNEFGKMRYELVAIDNGLIYFKRALGVEFSQEVIKAEFTEGVIEEMIDIIDKSVKKLAARG